MDHQDHEHDHDIDIPPYASPRQQSRGFDAEMRRMAVIAGGFAVVIVGVALVWGGVHPHLGPAPVIKPPPGPMRTAPENPGGLQVPGANEQIMSGTTASGPPQLAPAPPPPNFSKLAQEEAAARSPPAAAPAPPTVAADAAASPGATDTIAALPAPPPAVAPAHAPSPPPKPAPAVPAPASQVGKAAPAITEPAMADTAGPITVQLAALVSKEKADTAWRRLRARAPDLLAGRKPIVMTGTVDGRTYYRLRLGGFMTAAAAADFCAQLKTRHISCYIPR